MPKKKTHEEFLNEMKIAYPHLQFLSQYDGSRNEVMVFNTLCSHTYKTTPSQIYRGNNCPKCYVAKENNKNAYIKKLTSKYNNSLTLITEYKGMKNDVSYHCNICGYIDTARADTLLLYGCRNCNLKNRTKTHKDFIKEMSCINPNIEILSEYKTSRDKVCCRCKTCGYEWNSLPGNLTSHKQGCPSCKGVLKRTHEEFVDKVFKSGKQITFLSEYQGIDNVIECRCDLCGHTWGTRAGKIINEDVGCPNCRRSKGEERIARYLDENNISYVAQKKFESLLGVGNGKLSYDFFIPSHNILIEFNGLQHEKEVEWFGGKERLETQREHDIRKKKYAEKNGYVLLVIRYCDIHNIEKILQDNLIEKF